MKRPGTFNLWERFIKGDNDALSDLFQFYVHDLYSYGIKIHADAPLVKDCIQEIFINLIDKRKTLTPNDFTHLYLFKSLRNKLMEELKSKNRRIDLLKSISLDIPKYDISIEQSKVISEERELRNIILAKALSKLSDYQVEALHLKYSQGFEYDKIAEILQIDIASARTLIYRSLKKVKEAIFVNAEILFLFFRSKH